MWFVVFCAFQVNTGEYDPLHIKQSRGATMRLVRLAFRHLDNVCPYKFPCLQIFDFNNLNESLYVLPPGQSGNWFSNLYDSQGEAWCVPSALFPRCCRESLISPFVSAR